jgi:hypothetical protein
MTSRLRLKCDGTRAETRICFSAKRPSPFKSAGASAQSTTGSRGVRISGSNAGYTTFRGSEGYWLPTPFASFPFTSPPVRHRVPSHFNWTLLSDIVCCLSGLVQFFTSYFQSGAHICRQLTRKHCQFQHGMSNCATARDIISVSIHSNIIARYCK